jgi:Domain of unknown function (DUF4395)
LESRLSEIAKRQFVRQQGFKNVSAASCDYAYSALMFQPRLFAVLVLLAIVLQSAPIFLILAAILWWNVLMAPRNPFDAIYNRVIAGPKRLPPLTPAPAPRRFSQGMAGTILAGAGLSLLAGRIGLAWILEGLVVIALGALVLGRFCLGSYLYYVLRGESGFANRTVPWSRVE